ncbi:MAG: VPLPA-CTERM-specific exosortase XrtD [Gammaproteobacteria bacterium]|nr:VPLPA-CTERM-specific exosortase XrtD [Gammaproteobacteria bacterium]
MNTVNEQSNLVWKESNLLWGLLAICAAMLGLIYYDGLELMVVWWNTREEYGHGYIIPFITLFLIWQKSDQLEKLEFSQSWLGVFILILGLGLFYLGELSSVYTVIQYAFLVALYGLVLSLTGWRSFKIVAIPLLILFFMIPLPNFIFNNLSSQLQLISSQIGVAFIRLFDISVYLEGNVIDLGQMQMQVVEACSGLNYLFPLMTLGFISAYFFKGEIWKKAIIFLSTIPLTVLMNSFRIGAIGVTVEYWGPELAEGVLHDFEGWVVFMGCIGILIIEMLILSSVGKTRLPLREAFGLDFPAPTPKDAEIKYRKIPKPFIASVVILALAALSSVAMPERTEIEPERKQYILFPVQLEGWEGKRGYLEQIYIDALQLDDYVMNDYMSAQGKTVNFYSAYYASQRKGASAHSPRSCIPGGGWRITSLEQQGVANVNISGQPLVVNRLVISKGEVKQLVYYWFQQRGRIVTNEYLVKWYLFWDALTRNRTDGALIRLTTLVDQNDSLDEADKRLSDFAARISPFITEYVPD